MDVISCPYRNLDAQVQLFIVCKGAYTFDSDRASVSWAPANVVFTLHPGLESEVIRGHCHFDSPQLRPGELVALSMRIAQPPMNSDVRVPWNPYELRHEPNLGHRLGSVQTRNINTFVFIASELGLGCSDWHIGCSVNAHLWGGPGEPSITWTNDCPVHVTHESTGSNDLAIYQNNF